MSCKNCLNGFKGPFGIDGFKDGGFKDGGFKDGGFKDGGFKDGGFKDGGFKDRLAIAWFTPILFLLIEFLPFSADIRKAHPATFLVVRVNSSPK